MKIVFFLMNLANVFIKYAIALTNAGEWGFMKKRQGFINENLGLMK